MNRAILLLVPSVFLLAVLGIALQSGSESQASTGPVQGNVNCSPNIDGFDGLAIAMHAAGVTATGDSNPQPAGGCPIIGVATFGGYPWGDLNCSGAVTIDDAIPALKFSAGLPVEHFANCVDVGQGFGSPTITASPSPSPFTFVCPSFGWSVAAGSATWGCASEERIDLHVDDGEHMLLRDGVTLTDTHLEADVSTANREAGLIIRAQDGNNGYVAVLIPNGTPFVSGVQFYKVVGGVFSALAVEPLPSNVQVNEVIHFEVDMVGTNVVVKVNGTTAIDINDATYSSGKVGLRAYADNVGPADTTWDNIAYNEIP
jgi:hypothetical protein